MRTSCIINVTLLTLSLVAAASATSSTSGRSNFLPFLLVLVLHPVFLLLQFLLFTYLVPGGPAWRGVPGSASRPRSPCGWPVLGSAPVLRHPLAHRKLAAMAWSSSSPSSNAASCRTLMPLSLGPSTRAIVSSNPTTAREILHSSAFADRPPKLAARMLMFDRAVGFCPSGEKWRRLRRAAVGRAFSPRGVAAQEALRSRVGNDMIGMIERRATGGVEVEVRDVLRWGAVEGAVTAVLGDGGWVGKSEKMEIGELVREAYEVMDWWGFMLEEYYLPEMLGGVVVELSGMGRRCRRLIQRVRKVFGAIVQKRVKMVMANSKGGEDEESDLLGVLLACPKEEKLSDSDMIAVLWEMIFRGADVVAILMEWIMARMVLHTDVQQKAQQEIHTHVGRARPVQDSDVSSLEYLQAAVKETLRMHPPGPLLSWARLATIDTFVGKVFVPAGTVAMVNMWAISHDEKMWKDPLTFRPERFLEDEDAADVTFIGSDLRLAPFGSGRRVCPGRVLALADVHLWVGRMLQGHRWVPSRPVHLDEQLRMSLEMKKPLVCFVEPM